MKYFYTLSILLALFAIQTIQTFAQTGAARGVLIVELQTGSALSASEEFIELYNNSYEAIDLGGWKIEYKSAGGESWQSKANLLGYIPPGGRYLLGTDEYGGQAAIKSGLAQTGGHIRLTDQDDNQIDLIGWGKATAPLGQAVAAPLGGESVKRRVNEDAEFLETANNEDDWIVSEHPTPTGVGWEPSAAITQPGQEMQAPDPELLYVVPEEPAPTEESRETPELYELVLISELLPDPDKPLTDADDEYVELYNPHANLVDVSGYVLETGKDYRYRYELNGVMPSQSFVAFYSSEGRMSLANSSGSARLKSPDGQIIAEIQYPKAKTGLSWSMHGSVWGWADPSPGAPNMLKTAVASEQSDERVTFASGSQLNTLVSQDDSSTSVSATAVTGNSQEALDDQPLAWAALAGVGCLGLLYVCYEYRHTIGTRFQSYRRNASNRRDNRPKPSRWRDNRLIKRCWRWQNSLRARIG